MIPGLKPYLPIRQRCGNIISLTLFPPDQILQKLDFMTTPFIEYIIGLNCHEITIMFDIKQEEGRN